MQTAISGDFFYKHANSRGKVPASFALVTEQGGSLASSGDFTGICTAGKQLVARTHLCT